MSDIKKISQAICYPLLFFPCISTCIYKCSTRIQNHLNKQLFWLWREGGSPVTQEYHDRTCAYDKFPAPQTDLERPETPHLGLQYQQFRYQQLPALLECQLAGAVQCGRKAIQYRQWQLVTTTLPWFALAVKVCSEVLRLLTIIPQSRCVR